MFYDTLKVPENYIGLVIGKKGKNLNRLRIKFKTQIFLNKDTFSIYSSNNHDDVIDCKNSMLKIYQKKLQDEECCPVCLEKIDFSKDYTVTKCGHKFHTSCLLESVKIKNTCPMCREVLVEKKEINIDSVVKRTITAVRNTNYTFYLYYYLCDIESYQIVVEEFIKEPIRYALREMLKNY